MQYKNWKGKKEERKERKEGMYFQNTCFVEIVK